MVKRHTLVFCVLVIGLIVSGFAMGVYYRISSQLITTGSMVSGSYSSVELHDWSYPLNKETLLNAALEIEEEGKSPKIYGISAVSYDSDYTDVIGVYGKVNISSMIAGKDYMNESLEPGTVIVPLSLANRKEGETISQKIGTQRRIGSQLYTIGGIYDDALYTPTFYDVRRISDSSYEVSGITPPEEQIDRDTVGVFVPFDEMGEGRISSFRITYMTGLTDAQRTDIEKELFIRAIYNPEIMGEMNEEDLNTAFEIIRESAFAKWESANEALSAGYYSQLLLYILAIILSLINVITLYSSVLDMNRRQNEVFEVCGMTKGSRTMLIIAEVIIYSVISFAIGLSASEVFAMNSDLIPVVGTLSFGTHVLLAVCMIVVVLLMMSFSIRKYVKGRDELQ